LTITVGRRSEASRAALFELLDVAWDGIADNLEIARALGVEWTEHSIAHTVEERGRPVAHAGVLLVPATLENRAVTVAGIHAVVVAPEHRGRGLARRVIEAAIATADQHTQTTVLFTSIPSLYERFGFRVIPEFDVVLDRPGARAGHGARPVDLLDAAERREVRALAASRAPLDPRYATRDDGWLVLLDEVLGTGGRLHRLWWLPDRRGVVVIEHWEDDLVLLDVLAPEIPSLESILAALPRPARRVRVAVPTGQLQLTGPRRLVPRVAGDVDVLCVRGPFPAGPSAAGLGRPLLARGVAVETPSEPPFVVPWLARL
jgi:GNAT superfamily N-acetyltransferase